MEKRVNENPKEHKEQHEGTLKTGIAKRLADFFVNEWNQGKRKRRGRAKK